MTGERIVHPSTVVVVVGVAINAIAFGGRRVTGSGREIARIRWSASVCGGCRGKDEGRTSREAVSVSHCVFACVDSMPYAVGCPVPSLPAL